MQPIKDQIRETLSVLVREALPDVVRDVLASEFGNGTSSKKRSKRLDSHPRVPREAAEAGVKVGQKWRGKTYVKGAAGRLIQIAVLKKDGVLPKVLRTKGKRSSAKHISYSILTKTYERVN